MAGDVSFSGLSSGIDTGAIVAQLVALERRPINLLESKKSDLTAQRGKLQDLTSKITALETAAEELSKMSDLAFYSSSSSDEDVLNATMTGDARPGNYDIEVTSLAEVDRNYSTDFGSDAIGFADGDELEITIDGVTSTITFEAGDTLEDVVNRINGSDAAAWATVIGDGDGGGRLLIASEETGVSQHVTFGGSAVATLSMTNNQLASDATVVIDGLVTATSSSNHFEEVLEGLTLDITTLGTSTLTVSADSDGFKEKVTAFVNAYNDVAKAVNNEFAWTGDARTGSNLSGDSTLRSIQTTLRSAVSTVVDGVDTSCNMLAHIGISTNRDGELEIDETELDAALVNDLQAVKDLFAQNTDTGTTGLAYQMVNPMGDATLSLLDSIIDSHVGSLAVRIEGIDSRTEDIDVSVERMEMRLESYEQRLRNQFMQMEQMISTLNSQSGFLAGLGTFGGTG